LARELTAAATHRGATGSSSDTRLPLTARLHPSALCPNTLHRACAKRAGLATSKRTSHSMHNREKRRTSAIPLSPIFLLLLLPPPPSWLLRRSAAGTSGKASACWPPQKPTIRESLPFRYPSTAAVMGSLAGAAGIAVEGTSSTFCPCPCPCPSRRPRRAIISSGLPKYVQSCS